MHNSDFQSTDQRKLKDVARVLIGGDGLYLCLARHFLHRGCHRLAVLSVQISGDFNLKKLRFGSNTNNLA